MRKRDRMRSGGTVWLTSFNYPKSEVMTIGKEVTIGIFMKKGETGFGFTISRRLARMLAKRINQALDASK